MFSTEAGTGMDNASSSTDNYTTPSNDTASRRIPYSSDTNLYLDIMLGFLATMGVLSNAAVLGVLFQKKHRKLAANLYLVNLAIGRSIIITRVASHLARSDTPGITCIVARLSRSDTTRRSDQWQGFALVSDQQRPQSCTRKFHNQFTKLAVTQKI